MKLWIILLVAFAVLFTTRIFLPLRIGPKPQIIEQKRPSVPEPNHISSLEQEEDESRFEQMAKELSWQSSLPVDQVKACMRTSIEKMQRSLPFDFAGAFYNILCLPEPTATYETHKRVYLGESLLGMAIYANVRVYESSKEDVLEELFASIDGQFEQQEVAQGVCYIGHGRPAIGQGHSFSFAQAERTLFFHLIEKKGRIFVAHVEAPREDLEQLFTHDELLCLAKL